MDKVVCFRTEGCGVPDFISAYPEILGYEKAYVLQFAGMVFNGDFFDIDVFMEVYNVVGGDADFQLLVPEKHICGERVVKVICPDIPSLRNPAEIPVHPDAEAERPALRVILIAHMREKEFAEQIIPVKGYQHASVPNWNVSGHGFLQNPRRASPAMSNIQ
jgi:hypothetical protein